eukprot:5909-Heterococcus_DN1.PRE.4
MAHLPEGEKKGHSSRKRGPLPQCTILRDTAVLSTTQAAAMPTSQPRAGTVAGGRKAQTRPLATLCTPRPLPRPMPMPRLTLAVRPFST